MSDVELFLVLIAALFIYESVVTLPKDALALRRGAFGWRYVEPLVLRAGAGPAVVLAMLVPPLGLVVSGRRGGRLARAEAAVRVQALVRATRSLRVAASVLWLGLVAGAGWLAFGSAEHETLALVSLGALWVLAVLAGLEARRRLVAAGSLVRTVAPPSWRDTIVALLSPISILRLHDLYTKRALEDLDVLAIAAAVLPVERVRPLLREALARAVHGVEMVRERAELEALAVELGIAPGELLAAPEREGAHAHAYCPVCLAQYMGEGEGAQSVCESCGGVALLRF